MGEEKLSPDTIQKRLETRMKLQGEKKVNETATKLGVLEVEYVPIDAVIPNSWNPNQQDDEQFELLLRSIVSDGFTQPILVNTDVEDLPADKVGMIVDGEHRWRAAKTVGLERVPIVRVNMSQAQAMISTVRHNRARGSHDSEMVGDVLKDIEALGGLESAASELMLGDDELQRLMNDDFSAVTAYADSDYSEAWEPAAVDEAAQLVILDQSSTKAVETQDQFGGLMMQAMSTSAIEAAKELQARTATASSPEELSKIRNQIGLYRLNVLFTGDDANLVRGVLGSEPSERLLHLIRTYGDAI